MNAKQRDEELVVSYVLGQCAAGELEEVKRRLEAEPDFAQLHQAVARACAVMGRYEALEPPENLVGRTLARVQAMRRSEALLEVRPFKRSAAARTFAFREVAALAAAAIVVIGIVVPSVRQARRLADKSLCAANAGVIGTAVRHYASGNQDLLPSSAAGSSLWLRRGNKSYASNTASLFQLVRQGYATSDVFQCPAGGSQTFAVRAGMVDFPSPRTIGYSYQHSLGRPLRMNQPELAGVASEMAILADATPLFVNGQFRADRLNQAVSDNHPVGGQNVLYLDGHVDWATNSNVGVNGNNIWLAEGITEYTGLERPVSVDDTFLLPHPGD